jgi:hypothetical protein
MRNAHQLLHDLTERQNQKADLMHKGMITREDVLQELLTEEQQNALMQGRIAGLREAAVIAEMHEKYAVMELILQEARQLEQSNGSTPTGS